MPDACASARSTSSGVKFLDCRNSILFSTGDDATEGSCRKFTADETRSWRGAILAVTLGLLKKHQNVVYQDF